MKNELSSSVSPLMGEFSLAPEHLSNAERRWVGYQPYLLSKGYQLRPRYQPNWIPSWELNGQDARLCEDGWAAIAYRTLDAVRIVDQKLVMIKMIIPSLETQEGLHELDIMRRFSSAEFANDEDNHVVPILDAFGIPGVGGGMFYIMPLLTPYDRPPFQSLNEIYDFLRQTFEGLLFLHRNNIAHRDIASANVMMDARPLYYEQFHPLHPSFTHDGQHLVQTRNRTEAPVKYYYIDFGFSFWRRDGGSNWARGKEAREPAPEQAEGLAYDPFSADVYQLGALIRRDLIPGIPSLKFMIPLARAMTEKDPQKRTKLSEAREAMHHSFRAQGARRLRWPLIPRNATFSQWLYLTSWGVYNEVMIFMRSVARFFISC
ncbi:unnamed protein product [Rhizoctonia solani]|uniref:Protein kinase domain-containing protein n=1 Tax=Rhizoctonia solani TaxID=456999 RepID=A0A8H3GJM7_9AGAM|nr:unnamed protein product [Rhizoctonia solani]